MNSKNVLIDTLIAASVALLEWLLIGSMMPYLYIGAVQGCMAALSTIRDRRDGRMVLPVWFSIFVFALWPAILAHEVRELINSGNRRF